MFRPPQKMVTNPQTPNLEPQTECMATYRYRAIRRDGGVIEQSLEADSEQDAKSRVESQGSLVVKLERAGRGNGSSIQISKGRFGLRDFLVFNQEFLALIKAGLPPLRVFDLLADRTTSPDFRTALQEVRASIRSGASISAAMADHQRFFPELYQASIRAGEQAGNLVEVLTRYIAYLKRIIDLRERVRKALAYPVFLVIVGIAVVAFLTGYVLPYFSAIYGDDQASLPAATRFLLETVQHSHLWLPWVLGSCALLGLGLYAWSRTPAGRLTLDRLMLRLPMLGEILLKSQVIRMARTLATVLASGFPLLVALQTTKGGLTNRALASALVSAIERVKEGVGLAGALKESGLFPRLTVEMIAVGESTGELVTMLQDVAEFHESELDLALHQLTTWIEPALLLIMGILVGGIVITMYLPVFQLAGRV